MKVKDLLSAVKVIQLQGVLPDTVAAVEADSRKIKADYLFVAVRGSQVDGHQYIDKAVELGATVVVCEELPVSCASGVAYVRVANTAEALGRLASQWYGNPSAALTLVGVTGTNGKTTTATLLYEMFRLYGYKVGLLSTVCNYVDDEAVQATHTTPDPISLNALLRRMVDAGCTYAFMEVSSHSAHQHRIAGLQFAGGIFSNLTRDHMDYHKTVDAYLQAKKMFFDALPVGSFALTNIDDKVGEVMLQNCRARKYTYSLRAMADFKARTIESRLDGTLVAFDGREVETHFVGRFNVYNLLAVYAATCLLGQDKEQTLINMSLLTPVAGRFQTVYSPRGYVAVIDYAHTPDALTNVLSTLRDVLSKDGHIITVVGAGGNRDKGKRPIMAREAAKLSDELVLTSDNPRFENPDEILADMQAGLDVEAMKHTLAITDRRQAIRAAVRLAQPGDVILIAGKGHEDYQEIQGVKHHFDDREEVEMIFAE
ncbi:MAG: UDP-N-acetylmuramoyl-L-alanyl-D-glutamate--2,6-diaminopimelate ligase [Bacteroidaceae bacterium]|nr:UDP-N-acetylmuramoyl-L-alanyl-D-glutamate--2,6-diaminopimelate ligase [Bacteroidaceae bacterium]